MRVPIGAQIAAKGYESQLEYFVSSAFGGLEMFQFCGRLVGVVILGLATLLPSTANAALIDFQGVGHASTVSISGVRNGTFSAGELNWVWIGTAPEGFASSFYSYCVDVSQNLRDPQDVSVRSSDGFSNGVAGGGSKAAWLFNEYAAGIRSSVGTTANIMAAALQVAIWEATYDTARDLAGGNFVLNTTGTIRTYANTYLQELYSAGAASWTSASATVLEARSGQDQITAHVSEPSSLLLMGVAFLVFANRLRRPVA